jgi:hypothetical protein
MVPASTAAEPETIMRRSRRIQIPFTFFTFSTG